MSEYVRLDMNTLEAQDLGWVIQKAVAVVDDALSDAGKVLNLGSTELCEQLSQTRHEARLLVAGVLVRLT